MILNSFNNPINANLEGKKSVDDNNLSRSQAKIQFEMLQELCVRFNLGSKEVTDLDTRGYSFQSFLDRIALALEKMVTLGEQYENLKSVADVTAANYATLQREFVEYKDTANAQLLKKSNEVVRLETVSKEISKERDTILKDIHLTREGLKSPSSSEKKVLVVKIRLSQ